MDIGRARVVVTGSDGHLPRHADPSAELLMTGDMHTAERAGRLGLINHVVAPEALDDMVEAIVAKLTGGAGLAIRATKTVAKIPPRKLAQELMDASLS